jgi:phosphoribosylanthranilate isomerase
MKLKVCGLFETGNILDVCRLKPDYIGFIFYAQSPRFANIESILPVRNDIPATVKTIGVFVDEDHNSILSIIDKLSLDGVQLHGATSAEVAGTLREKGFQGEIFLAANIENPPDFKNLNNIDYIVFDTPTPLHGGSGISFDWTKLNTYGADIPFFLSGGIGEHNIKEAILFNHPKCIGIDMNSRLEREDKTKDFNKVLYCIEQVRSYEGR